MCQQIPLSRNAFALVSDEDYERISQHKWSLDGTGYAVRLVTVVVDGVKKRRKILMHREILNAPPHLEVDHRFDIRTDNRRSEIRIATHGQNMANRGPQQGSSCQYKGVSYSKRDKVWVAEIRVDGNRKRLGSYKNAANAAIAYDKAALTAWPEFAYLNFPEYRHIYHQCQTITRRLRATRIPLPTA